MRNYLIFEDWGVFDISMKGLIIPSVKYSTIMKNHTGNAMETRVRYGLYKA